MLAPTEEEINFFQDTLKRKEKDVSARIGLSEPSTPAKIAIAELDKNINGSYSPRLGPHEDIYIFKIGSSGREDIYETVSHEATHRLYYWNIGMNSQPNITPASLYDHEKAIIKEISRGNPVLVKVLDFFNISLSETFDYFGERVVEEKEIKPIKYGGNAAKLESVARVLLPANKEDATILAQKLTRLVLNGTDITDILPNTLGYIIGREIYRKYGQREEDIAVVKSTFTGYDPSSVCPADFNPLLRYSRLSFR